MTHSVISKHGAMLPMQIPLHERRLLKAFKKMMSGPEKEEIKTDNPGVRIRRPKKLFHGGARKENFNYTPRSIGADGVGHYLSNSRDVARKYSEEVDPNTFGHIHHVEMHIHSKNVANMDLPSQDKKQPATVRKGMKEIYRRHAGGIRPILRPHENHMQTEVKYLGHHFNRMAGRHYNDMQGHVEAAEELYKRGIHAGKGEYPLGKRGSKMATSYCVFGDGKHHLNVTHIEKRNNE